MKILNFQITVFFPLLYVVDYNILVILGNTESIYLKEMHESLEREEKLDAMAWMN